ncbi:hypothetical protein POM88_043160 [Heracleum sosnowskyi]|uniref:non-specific serine/threonine protein kinase n=1 Tax=Heracleum sosnowskyi TaxID=360622 RepID=A0AAD8H1G8_9APIA|nr:hypothetical protein POM88_043160 [Heracleum sosnowskyi]
MLLELITGKLPVDMDDDENDTLIDWARPILMRAVEGGDYNELVDPRLLDNYDADEMLRMVACAAACIRHSSRRRPKMSQIVRALEGDVSLEDLMSTHARPVLVFTGVYDIITGAIYVVPMPVQPMKSISAVRCHFHTRIRYSGGNGCWNLY